MPFTLFCHQHAAQDALSFLRERGAVVDGDENKWAASFAGDAGGQGSIRFNHDRGWCSPPNWPKQLAGMANYLRQFGMADGTRRLLMALIPHLKFSIGVVTVPEISDTDDQRLALIQALAEHLGCVVFTPGRLLDPRLRVLAAADGQVDDDAEMPLGAVGVPPLAFDEEEEEEFEPPAPKRVALRLYALIAVVARGLFEMNVKAGRSPAYSLAELRRWTDQLGLAQELEPEEAAILGAAQRELSARVITDSVWRVEGAAVLAWALNLARLPAYDALVVIDDLLPAVAFLDAGRSAQILALPSLRSADELARVGEQMLAYHWRMVDFRVQPKAIEFDRVAIFGGPFDLSWASLVDADLALQGHPISVAEPELVHTCGSISVERFQAANWLNGYHAVYSETPTDT